MVSSQPLGSSANSHLNLRSVAICVLCFFVGRYSSQYEYETKGAFFKNSSTIAVNREAVKEQVPTINEEQSQSKVETEQSKVEAELNSIKKFEGLFKASDKTWRHGYHWFYGRHLAKYRMKEDLAILEIGADSGKSALAWPNIFGEHVNIDMLTYGGKGDNIKFNNPTINCKREGNTTKGGESCKGQIHTFYCDQSNVEKLKKEVIAQRPGGWDVVVDDGSHVPAHNIISFETLWKNVRPGGLYVIEDIETSYYPQTSLYGYTFKAGILAPSPLNVLSRFRKYADVINRGYIGENGHRYSLFEGDDSIMEIGFARNIIFIRKALDGVDSSGKTYGTYPIEPVQLSGYAGIHTGAEEALKIFKEESTALHKWITNSSAVSA